MTVLVTAGSGLFFALVAPVVVPIVFGEAYRGAALVLACLVPGSRRARGLLHDLTTALPRGPHLVSAIGALAALGVLWAFSLYAPCAVSLPKVALASSLWPIGHSRASNSLYLVSRGRIETRALVPGPSEFAGLRGVVGRSSERIASGRSLALATAWC